MARDQVSVVGGSTTILLSLIVSGVISILLSILIARSVRATEFGIYAMVVSTQVIVILFAGFAMGTTLAKFISEYTVRSPPEARALAKVGLVLVALFTGASTSAYVALKDFIGKGLFNEPRVSELIPLSALVVLSTVLFSTAFGMVQGCQRIRALAVMRVLSPMLSIGLVAVLLRVFNLEGVFIGLFLGQTSVAIGTLVWLNRSRFQFTYSAIRGSVSMHSKRLLAYSIPAVLSASLVVPVVWLGNTALALSTSFEILAYFAVAYVTFQSLNVFPQSIVIPLIPRVSELSIASPKDIPASIVWTLRFSSVTLLPIVVSVALFAKPIVTLLYGEAYAPAADAVYLMVTASYFYATASIIGAAIAGIGRVWVGFGLNALWALLFLVLSAFLIPRWGVLGLAATFSCSYAAHVVSSFVVMKKVVRVDLREGCLLPAVGTLLLLLGYLLTSTGALESWPAKVVLLVVTIAVVFRLGKETVRMLIGELKSHVGLYSE